MVVHTTFRSRPTTSSPSFPMSRSELFVAAETPRIRVTRGSSTFRRTELVVPPLPTYTRVKVIVSSSYTPKTKATSTTFTFTRSTVSVPSFSALTVVEMLEPPSDTPGSQVTTGSSPSAGESVWSPSLPTVAVLKVFVETSHTSSVLTTTGGPTSSRVVVFSSSELATTVVEVVVSSYIRLKAVVTVCTSLSRLTSVGSSLATGQSVSSLVRVPGVRVGLTTLIDSHRTRSVPSVSWPRAQPSLVAPPRVAR